MSAPCPHFLVSFLAFFANGLRKPPRSSRLDTLRNAAFSALLVGQQAARLMGENKPNANGTKGAIIFTKRKRGTERLPN